MALLTCVAVSSTMAGLHGLVLLAQAKEIKGYVEKMGGEAERNMLLSLATDSTWALWALLTLVTSVVAASITTWLRGRIERQIRDLQRDETDKYLGPLSFLQEKLAVAREQVKEHLETVRGYVDARSKIEAEFAAAQTWPLPKGALAAISVTALGQLINLAAGVYTFLISGVIVPK